MPVIIWSIGEKRGERQEQQESPSIEYILESLTQKRQNGKLCVLYTTLFSQSKNTKIDEIRVCVCVCVSVCVGGGLEDDDAHTIPNGLYYTHQSAT